MRFWIGVASRDHVRAGVAGGFCQLCHGEAAPVRRLRSGDRIVYYSPATRMRGGEPVQAFTAIGLVEGGEPYAYDMGGDFVPFRRPVAFLEASEAPIRSLLPRLSFTEGRASWGYAFRRGAFEITPKDYRVIACAMGVTDHVDQVGSDPALPGDAESTSRDTSSAKDLPLASRRPSASTKPS